MSWRDDVTAHVTKYLALNYNAMRDYIISHASTHISTGEQAIPVATTTTTGLCPVLDDDAAHFLNGDGGWTTPSYIAAAHATEHITGGTDIIPVATTSTTGLSPVLPNDATLFLDGTGIFSTPDPGSASRIKDFNLTAYNALLAVTAPALDQTELSNGFPLPKAIFTVAGKGVDELYWISFMRSDWDEGIVSAYIEFTTPTSSNLMVQWVLSAIRLKPGESYTSAPQVVVYSDATLSSYAANVKNTGAVHDFTIPGNVGATTILWRLRRGDDTYTGNAHFVAIRGTYTGG